MNGYPGINFSSNKANSNIVDVNNVIYRSSGHLLPRYRPEVFFRHGERLVYFSDPEIQASDNVNIKMLSSSSLDSKALEIGRQHEIIFSHVRIVEGGILYDATYRNNIDRMVILRVMGDDCYRVERIVFPYEIVNFSCPPNSEVKLESRGCNGTQLLATYLIDDLKTNQSPVLPDSITHFFASIK